MRETPNTGQELVSMSSKQWTEQDVKRWLTYLLKFIVWLTGLYACCFIYMQKIYFIGSGFYFIFTNLGKRKQGEMSAYSVFNKGYKQLPGTFSAQDMFKGRTHSKPPQNQNQKIMDDDQLQKAKFIDEYFKNQSKYANRPCYCGSQIKFKKCCLPKKRLQQEEQKKKRLQRQKDQ